MEAKNCIIGPLYKNLNDKDISLILSKGIQKNYKKGETIVYPGETSSRIFILKKGQVKITQLSREGKKFILEIVRPGGIFSSEGFGLFHKGDFKDFVEVDKNSEVCEITKDDFVLLLKEIPSLSLNLIDILAEKLNLADNKLRDIALLDVKSRLKHELIHIARTIGFDKGEFYVIREKFTHEQLGEMLGTSRETITKSMSELKKEGFVSYDDLNRIIIKHK
ncbi:TPA: hypothetical protein DDW69_01215 [candidate division CPR2 bacterium]|uniref:CRP/FNR family transcription regulator n=1 Tax=candidate division CPR2 bacterium GW2011_GWC1_41_48 TaxID=1618344 RepID=A0A0G0W9H7_UNCC2|nr:MAG: CRP/FNR family transcription regulator [candidate division CPR2 bacterium GW2011_GWC2_39_35]KKR29489.1 MAG: CRP/FNR family transcription regulator [candidate division CPR2 bacterium GW2011_GWD2_39_7]KKR29714.1 MAG: CRP/FNR family transcription regulator [candidate division CPR2 bacterium GW2011_GWD1_39_7]KKS09644.1 MAG: CRP/FNR family transcription regulator [candidate division CPR2 bacterium GW2011_GWC1_41_48]OGB59499.1 MAG: hypothetical protein A2Y27_00905 [candidate division CPR2 bac